MSHDRFVTVLLDIIDEYLRGFLSSADVITSIATLVRCREDYEEPLRSELGHILVETLDSLPDEVAQMWEVATPLLLEVAAAYADCSEDLEKYERYADAMESTLLDLLIDEDHTVRTIPAIASLFPPTRYAFPGTLISRILATNL